MILIYGKSSQNRSVRVVVEKYVEKHFDRCPFRIEIR